MASREHYDPDKVEGLLHAVADFLGAHNDLGKADEYLIARVGHAARAVETDGVLYSPPQNSATVSINGEVQTSKVI